MIGTSLKVEERKGGGTFHHSSTQEIAKNSVGLKKALIKTVLSEKALKKKVQNN